MASFAEFVATSCDGLSGYSEQQQQSHLHQQQEEPGHETQRQEQQQHTSHGDGRIEQIDFSCLVTTSSYSNDECVLSWKPFEPLLTVNTSCMWVLAFFIYLIGSANFFPLSEWLHVNSNANNTRAYVVLVGQLLIYSSWFGLWL